MKFLSEIKNLLKTSRMLKALIFTLLTAMLLMAVLNLAMQSVKAQTTDTVVILTSIGGTTSPSGTNSYPDGSVQTFTATPTGDEYSFVDWEISTAAGATFTSTNPLSLTLNESSYTLQAIFQPILYIPPATAPTSATDAIVVILAGVGGNVSPAPGTYALSNAASLNLTATADSGWTFDHWVIAGTPMNHGAYSLTLTPTNNPYNVNHGYGNTYSYQPVFSPISTTATPTPTVNEFSTATTLIAVIALVAAAFGTYTYTKKAKK